MSEADELDQLSPLERQLVELVVRGLRDPDIALSLGITKSEVQSHLASVFSKLGVRDRLELFLFVQTGDDTPEL